MLKREMYLKKIRPFYDLDLIKVLIGIRRCGKSVLLRQIMEEIKDAGISDENIIYINFEDLDYGFMKNEYDLHQYIKDRVVKTDIKYYLFFDEIQNVENFEKAINSFKATLNVSIFITGSNGKLLSGELATFLTGRYVSFKIMPFCFSEICNMKQINYQDATEDDLMDFLIWGGMPQRFQFGLEDEIKIYLTDLFNSIVLRDIVQRSRIKDVELLNRIIEYMVLHPSQIFSAASVSKYFESINRKISTETIYNYLEYITDSFIINRVNRYDIRGKKILTKMDKYYLTDLGLGRVRNTCFKTEIGALLENMIYNELVIRGYEVYVGKTIKGEVDFIAIKDNIKEYYQVAYLLADDIIIQREFGAYQEVPDHYPKYVLSMDRFDFSRDGIIHKNILDFLIQGM